MNEEMAHWLDIVRNSRGVPEETDHFFHMQKHWRIFEPYLDGPVSFFLTVNAADNLDKKRQLFGSELIRLLTIITVIPDEFSCKIHKP